MYMYIYIYIYVYVYIYIYIYIYMKGCFEVETSHDPGIWEHRFELLTLTACHWELFFFVFFPIDARFCELRCAVFFAPSSLPRHMPTPSEVDWGLFFGMFFWEPAELPNAVSRGTPLDGDLRFSPLSDRTENDKNHDNDNADRHNDTYSGDNNNGDDDSNTNNSNNRPAIGRDGEKCRRGIYLHICMNSNYYDCKSLVLCIKY